MTKIDDQIAGELQELADETETGLKETVEKTVADAFRRFESDKAGRMVIIAGFILWSMYNVVMRWLQEREVVSQEVLEQILLIAILYMVFRLFVLLYNHLALKIQSRAIELDVKELGIKKEEVKGEIDALEQKAAIIRDNESFRREQERIDRKFDSDLELRTPFFEASYGKVIGMATGEVRANASDVSNLVERVRDMDTILMKRHEDSEAVREVKEELQNISAHYDDVRHESTKTAKLMDMLMQEVATVTVQYSEVKQELAATRNDMQSVANKFDNFMTVVNSRLEKIELALAPAPEPQPQDPDVEGEDNKSDGGTGAVEEEPSSGEGAEGWGDDNGIPPPPPPPPPS